MYRVAMIAASMLLALLVLLAGSQGPRPAQAQAGAPFWSQVALGLPASVRLTVCAMPPPIPA